MRLTPQLHYYIFFFLWAVAHNASANVTNDLDLEEQRGIFLKAEQALKENDKAKYPELKKSLTNYPLLVYLEYQEISQSLPNQSTTAIKAFLDKHADTPLKGQLLNEWLNYLARNKMWTTYLQFSSAGGGVTQQCNRIHALLATGKSKQAFAAMEPIWLSGSSRPKACDPVIKAWIDAGHLTRKLAWQRIELAMGKGEIQLATYLKRYLPKSEQDLVENWITLRNHPESINPAALAKHPSRNAVIAQTLRRLASKDPGKAIAIWRDSRSRYAFTDDQQLGVLTALARNLVRASDEQLAKEFQSLIPSNLQNNPQIVETQFQAAVLQESWDKVLHIIEGLSTTEKADERWVYWRAKALGNKGQSAEGVKLLKTIAGERSYYGFIAALQLDQQPEFTHQPLTVSESLMTEMAAHPGLLRARELHALSREYKARQEWNLAMQGLTIDKIKAAVKLAQQWDWPSQSILTLARIGHWNDLELRFPLTYRNQIDRNAKANGLDSAWVYAILRQESAFMPDARSSSGALGLMQLMPGTAKEVASKLKNRSFKVADLTTPDVNIAMGTSYLNQVYQQLLSNPVLATAAYNAGPHRVLKWLPEKPQATDAWIETVPFTETRNYLKHVLLYTMIYAHRLGKSPVEVAEHWQKPITSQQHGKS